MMSGVDQATKASPVDPESGQIGVCVVYPDTKYPLGCLEHFDAVGLNKGKS
jgi:hypothetical protein